MTGILALPTAAGEVATFGLIVTGVVITAAVAIPAVGVGALIGAIVGRVKSDTTAAEGAVKGARIGAGAAVAVAAIVVGIPLVICGGLTLGSERLMQTALVKSKVMKGGKNSWSLMYGAEVNVIQGPVEKLMMATMNMALVVMLAPAFFKR